MRSSAGDRVDVLDAGGQRILAPASARVERAEDPPGAGDTEDLIGVAVMECHRRHRAIGLHAVTEACPRRAAAAATVPPPVLASRRPPPSRAEHAPRRL